MVTEGEMGEGLVGLLLAALPLDRRVRIVDVGANPINEPPYRDLLRAGGCDLVGFEPNPEAFAALEASKSQFETYFPSAVGDGTETELKLYRSSGMTSVFEPDMAAMRVLGRPRWGQVKARVPLETVSLDEVALGEVDLLKIDIQGGELDVFRSAGRTLAGAVAVITELRFFPLYLDEPMLGAVDGELRRQGFLLHKLLHTATRPFPNSQAARLRPRRVSDQLVDGDAVYIRDLRGLDDWPDAMIARLALLSGAVFASHSLCLMSLDALAGRGAVSADLASRYVEMLPDALRAPGAAASGSEEPDAKWELSP
jgi:FkbM family methyltransferase